MPTVEIDDDAAKLLADACAEHGLSPKTVIILALEALHAKRASGGTRRASGAGTASGGAVKRRLPNGVNNFLVKGYIPVRGNNMVGSLMLEGENGEEFKISFNNAASDSLKKDFEIRGINESTIVGQRIPLIAYAGMPVKTVSGTRLY